MIGTSDGRFLVVAKANNLHTMGNDIIVIKFDSGTNIQWIGLYGRSNSDLI